MDFRNTLKKAIPKFPAEILNLIVDYHGISDEAIQELIKVLQKRGQEIYEEGTYEVNTKAVILTFWMSTNVYTLRKYY
jgi:hypothetical protein